MAVPCLREMRCFIELDPSKIYLSDLPQAATIKGAFQIGKQAHPSEMKSVDLVVAGSVAVNREAVLEILKSDSEVLGSIMRRSHPLADKIKAMSDVIVREIHPGNRDRIAEQIFCVFQIGDH